MIKTLSKTKANPKIRINKKKSEEIRKDFYKLRHKFSKKEIDKYRKAFYDIKNYKNLFESEIEEVRENLNKLKKNLRFKKFHGGIDSVDYDDLDNYDFTYDDKYRKIGNIIKTLFERIRTYYWIIFKRCICLSTINPRQNQIMKKMKKIIAMLIVQNGKFN